MNYSFHPKAEIELNEAINYYEDQQENLGFDFSLEVYESIQRIVANPELWTRVSDSIQRMLVKRFPFCILYHFDSDAEHVIIVAIMHLRREPGYWKERVG